MIVQLHLDFKTFCCFGKLELAEYAPVVVAFGLKGLRDGSKHTDDKVKTKDNLLQRQQT
jgi:hypothetical protein